MMWDQWTEFLAFADDVIELGRRESVLLVDAIPLASARDQAIFGDIVPSTRVSVFGPSGIEDRLVRDVGTEFLALRPELEPDSVPHASALSIKGPLFLDRDGPVEVSISIQDAYAKYQADYQAYRNLPEEADAWAAGDADEAAFKNPYPKGSAQEEAFRRALMNAGHKSLK